MSVRLTALSQLCGDYGLVAPGESFEAEDDVAESLESRGLAERYHPVLPPLPPAFLAKMMSAPENKMVQPIENKAAEVPPAPRRKRR